MTGPRPSLEDVVSRTDTRPPLDAIVAATDPLAKLHADYQSGALQARTAVENATDPDRLLGQNVAHGIQSGAEAVASGVPGANRAIAGYRGLLSLAGLGEENPEQALGEQRKNIAALPTSTRVPLQLLGGAATTAAIPAKLGVMGGSAAYGAAAGADQPAETLGQGVKNIAGGAALGAAAGKAGQLVGRGVANVASRTGLTDLLSGGAAKAAEGLRRLGDKGPMLRQATEPAAAQLGDLSASMGTRGQVNQVLGDRQDILHQLGENGFTAGRQQLDRIAATKAKAGQLYDLARQDTQVIQDPRVQALMQDPEVTKTFQTVQALRQARGNPVPQVNSISAPPQAQLNKLIRPEDWARLMQNPENAAKLQQLPTGLSGLTTEAMPDPEALHMMKKYLDDAAKGLASPSDLTKDRAIATLAKVGQLRDILHEVSPPWKAADAFYSDAKGQEDAFAQGFDAFRSANNPSGEQLPTHTVEGLLQSIEEPRFPTEPAQAMTRRANALRAGVRSAMASAVRGAPVDRGMRSALATAPLAGDEETQAVRQLGFDNPQAGSLFERLLANQRGQAMNMPSPRGIEGGDLAYRHGLIRSGIRALSQPPDLLATPQGQQLLAERLASPSQKLKLSEIASGQSGQAMQDLLKRLATLSTAGQVAR